MFLAGLITKGNRHGARFVRRSEQRLSQDVLFGGANNDYGDDGYDDCAGVLRGGRGVNLRWEEKFLKSI